MKRPALYLGIPYILGLYLASMCGAAFCLPVAGGILLAALVVLVWRKGLWKYVLLSTLSCLTACCVYWGADAAVQPQKALAGTEQHFTGHITNRTVYPSGWTKYYLDGTFGNGIRAKVELFTELSDYACGDTLTLEGTPSAPEADALFDTASYERANRVFLCFDNTTEITESRPLAVPTLRSRLHAWRDTMTLRIRAHMREETGAMLTGMLFGDRAGMTNASKNALYRAGIGHVLTVSGLHLDFLALIAAFLLKKAKAGRKLSFVVIAVLCLLFVLCAGETVPVKRACVMILLSQLARVLYRQTDPLTSLSLAMLYLGIENPFVVCGANFWLTVSATYGIAVLGPFMTQRAQEDTIRQDIRNAVLCSSWAFVAMLPAQMLTFREISLLSPVSNTLLVPLCMGSMVLGMLALPFGAKGAFASWMLSGADVMNGWILRISRAVSDISWTHAATGSSLLPVTFAAGAVTVFVLWLLTRNRRVTTGAMAAVLLVTLLSVRTEQWYRRADLRMAVFCEPGASLVLLTDGDEAVLLDLTGSSRSASYAENYLSREGIGTVQTLCLCRPSAKSIRNYEKYLSFYKPEAFWQMQETDAEVPSLFGMAAEPRTECEFLFHGAKVHVGAAAATVTYAGNTCLFAAKANDVPAALQPEVLCIAGSVQEPLPDCGILLHADPESPYRADAHTIIGRQDTEITIAKDGSCRLRRLYGEN